MDVNSQLTWSIVKGMVDQLLVAKTGKHLTDIEAQVLQGAWEGKSYSAIADELGYTVEYINGDVGNALWQKISQAIGEKVGKRNFHGALERHWLSLPSSSTQPKQDLGNQENQSKYIERPPIEQRCFDAIVQPGALIRIKAPRKMGKTWLVDKILDYAQQQDYLIVPINLLKIESEVLRDLGRFLKYFCSRVTRKLGIENKLDNYWDEELGSNTSCTEYFEDYIFRNCDTQSPDNNPRPIVLALDNVDRLFPCTEVASNFFSLLRAWYEDARILPDWQRLRFIVAHSTDIYPTLNINRSPFNVGLAVELTEFSFEQMLELAQRQGLSPDSKHPHLEKLFQLIGGHPYLLQQGLEKLDNTLDMETFLEIAPTEAGPYAQYFRNLLSHLQDNHELGSAMKTVLQTSTPVKVKSELAFMLHSLGLVRFQGNEVEIFSPLYQLYLCDRLDDF
jgi:hypothetical protein